MATLPILTLLAFMLTSLIYSAPVRLQWDVIPTSEKSAVHQAVCQTHLSPRCHRPGSAATRSIDHRPEADSLVSLPRPQVRHRKAGLAATRPYAGHFTAGLARQAIDTPRRDRQLQRALSFTTVPTSNRTRHRCTDDHSLVFTRYNAELTGPQHRPRSGNLLLRVRVERRVI